MAIQDASGDRRLVESREIQQENKNNDYEKQAMKEYATYIFDLDGTLLDTLNDLAASTNYALRTHGMPEHSVEDVRRFVGNGVKKLMERAVPGGQSNPLFDEAYATFRRHYMEHSLDTTQPYPGVTEVLEELKRRGKKIAVVSNKFYAATQELCRHFFGNVVEVAIGERDNIRKKPAPDTVLEALRQLGADREGAVYIGDSDVDIATARNCAIPCISVLWGFRDRAFLAEHGAVTFIERIDELV
jgi:phosphoglycolate phosphatase